MNEKMGAIYGKLAKGFTLIELLIVMVIVGIIATYAIPGYKNSVMKSKRVSAQIALIEMAARQERFYTTNNRYTTSLTDLGYTTSPTITVPSGPSPLYRLQVVGTSGCSDLTSCIAMRAIPIFGTSQASDTNCGGFLITTSGRRTVSGTDTVRNCWKS